MTIVPSFSQHKLSLVVLGLCLLVVVMKFQIMGYSRKNPHPHDGRHAGKSYRRGAG